MTYQPNNPITDLPLVGPKYKELLEKLYIRTIKDLLYHFPSRYADTREISTLEQLLVKEQGTVEVELEDIKNIRTRNGKFLTKAHISDETGRIEAAWFNQPYLTKSLKPGHKYLMSGKINRKWGVNLTSPQYEELGQLSNVHLGKISPIYPETYGVSSKWLRARIATLKPEIDNIVVDYINSQLLSKFELLPQEKAISYMHFPESEDQIKSAQNRLGLDELVEIQKKAQKYLNERKRLEGIPVKANLNKGMAATLLNSLDFDLTSAQISSLKEITHDMDSKEPMNRLLNGDVGSGKTIVALLAATVMIENGQSAVIMAPTTVLAQQHYQSSIKAFQKAGLDIPIKLISGNQKDFLDESPQLIIGTHAIIYRTHLPQNTNLIVIDEQHRFGVGQREKLANLEIVKDHPAFNPHYLTMTATPIPRTLTMVMFGYTSVSTLNELPKNRKPVETHVVPEEKRDSSYGWIEKQVSENGDQVFIICPLVDESDKIEAKSAKEEYKRLKDKLPNCKLGLVHGQLKDSEKSKVLKDFKDRKFDVLVATPVVEVGIDIQNATIMVIENAERFGLAQLHQFRGRVGRGEKQSYCFLFTESKKDDALERLDYFSNHTSGFEVAEFDLQRRGPGEVYGLKQSGLLNLRFAKLGDRRQMKIAKELVETLNL